MPVLAHGVEARVLLAAAVFAHGVAGLGGDGLAELGEYDGDGERRTGVSMNGAQQTDGAPGLRSAFATTGVRLWGS